MRSKTVDAAFPKLGLEVVASGGAVPASPALTVATLNFKLERAGLFRIYHHVNTNHDSSSTLSGLNRQVFVDGTGLYTQVEIAAAAQQYVHGISSGSSIMRLGAGFHTVYMSVSSSVANIWTMQEGQLSVQEL